MSAWISHGCTCVPTSWTTLPSPSLPIPLGCPRAPALSAMLHALNLVIYLTYGNLHVSMLFSQKRRKSSFILPASSNPPSYQCSVPRGNNATRNISRHRVRKNGMSDQLLQPFEHHGKALFRIHSVKRSAKLWYVVMVGNKEEKRRLPISATEYEQPQFQWACLWL